MIILDTNVISELMRPSPHPHVRDWISGLDNHSLGTTAITLSELAFGLQRLPAGQRRNELHNRLGVLLQALPILPFDEPAAHAAAQLRAIREKAGLASTTADMMIAGISESLGSTLATRNVRDFSDLPITVINPWQTPLRE